GSARSDCRRRQRPIVLANAHYGGRLTTSYSQASKPTNMMSSLPNYSATSYRQASGAPYAKENREALIEAHLPQVKFIAARLAAKLPPSVEVDDLIGSGMLDLLDAVEKYDPGKGVMFKTYAEMRVRGAML